MILAYCIFVFWFVSAFGQQQGPEMSQQFGQMGQQFGPTIVNEGDPNCAQFWYSPNSLSAKCLVHKVSLEANRYTSFGITLTGLENPEFSGNSEITFVINDCRTTFAVSCTREQSCTVDYMANGFKRSLKAGLFRFVVNNDQVVGELAQNENSNLLEIYRCMSQSKTLNMTRSRHEVRIFLERGFPGHNFEIHNADVQRYRNGQSIYTAQRMRPEVDTYQATTFVPFAESSSEPSAVDIFRATIFQTTTPYSPYFTSTNNGEAAVIIEDRRRMELKRRIDGQLEEEFQQNSGVTVERMQRGPDGKHLLLDLIIRTRVEVPTSFV